MAHFKNRARSVGDFLPFYSRACFSCDDVGDSEQAYGFTKASLMTVEGEVDLKFSSHNVYNIFPLLFCLSCVHVWE